MYISQWAHGGSRQPADPFELQTKPHGHGDVHVLLSQGGKLAQWSTENRKWIFFFQDTNAHCFRTFVAALGVSILHDFDFNSITVPRKAGDPVGAICKLAAASGESMTLNVEYNQLDPLLRATVNPKGDVPGDDGLSPFPGNTNQLIVKLRTYATALAGTGGVVPEFVNPKYKDAAKEDFKAPTREPTNEAFVSPRGPARVGRRAYAGHHVQQGK